jgi:hypothetical protein
MLSRDPAARPDAAEVARALSSRSGRKRSVILAIVLASIAALALAAIAAMTRKELPAMRRYLTISRM